MSTPPPVPPQQPQQQPFGPQQPFEPQQPIEPQQPRKGNSNKTWIIVGCCIVGAALIAVAILYFTLWHKSSDGTPYSDGSNEQVIRNQDAPAEEEVKIEAPSIIPMGTRIAGLGTNDNSACGLDIEISDDGQVNGTWWNVLYCLKFNVTGTATRDGVLDLDLHIDKVTTPIHLTTTDGYNYSGTWGAQSAPKPVRLELKDGGMKMNQPGPERYSGRITGHGMNRTFRITEAPNGQLYWWYPDEGYQNRLKCDVDEDGNISIYTPFGDRQAIIYDNFDTGGWTLQDQSQTFDVYFD